MSYKKLMYNFIFPWGCDELQIGQYRIVKVPEYVERVESLQHLVNCSGEFQASIQTGKHAVTSIVECPEEQDESCFFPMQETFTALDDILLIVSLINQRDVFVMDEAPQVKESAILSDPREYLYGLRTATNFVEERISEYEIRDIGYQADVEKTYTTVRSPSWKRLYVDGGFLAYFKEACKVQFLPLAFVTCWSIWERLFALHHKDWLLDDSLRKIHASEKISFVLVKYGLMEFIDGSTRGAIEEKYVNLRNAVIHDCRWLDKEKSYDAHHFILVTEIIIAKVLDLDLSDVHDAVPRIKKRLSGSAPEPTLWEKLEKLRTREGT